jgi:hypothetical protein
MPRNNKGYDILVHRPDRDLHVEVKGARSLGPTFLITEGERLHSQSPANDYLLIVVHAIDLDQRTHEVTSRRGPVTTEACNLQPVHWGRPPGLNALT